jgi:hypothetical protein
MYEANSSTESRHPCRTVVRAVEFPEAVGASSANITAGVAGHCKKGVAYVVFDAKGGLPEESPI